MKTENKSHTWNLNFGIFRKILWLRRIGRLLFAIFILCLFYFPATQSLSAAEDTGQKRIPMFESGKIIIKFKEDIAELAFEEAKGKRVFKDRSGTAHLDHLNAKYRVKKIKKTIQGLERINNRNGLLKHLKMIKEKNEAGYAPFQKKALIEEKIENLHNIYTLYVAEGVDIERAVSEYRKDSNVEYAEPNYLLKPTGFSPPNDPYYSQQWALATMKAQAAWDLFPSQAEIGKGIIVAVLDTGVDITHEDLASNIWRNNSELNGAAGVDDDANGYVDDIYGWNFALQNNNLADNFFHGTPVAGIVAAVTNNAKGVAGLSYNSKLMALKVGSSAIRIDVAVEAFEYAFEKGARVINCSWGGYHNSSNLDSQMSAMHDSISTLSHAGVIFVAGAGNEGTDANFFPAGFPEVISVAASTETDQRAAYSDYGARTDVAAPGNNIMSATPAASGQLYRASNGTSYAAPQVSALVALILSKHPEYDYQQVQEIVRLSADDISDPGWDIYTGYGRINALKAMMMPTLPPAAPDAVIVSPASNAEIKDTVQIKGTASGSNFRNYSLSYIPLKNLVNGSWISLVSASSTPVTNGILYDQWNLGSLFDEAYVLKLEVKDTFGNSYTDRVIFTKNSVYFTNLKNEDYKRIGDTLTLNGSIRALNFQNFSIQYASVEAPNSWSSNGMTFVSGGTTQITESKIATWDTNQMPVKTAGYYFVRLLVNGGEAERVKIHLDPTLKPGWPVVIPWQSTSNSAARFNIVISDLNRDGKKELIFPITAWESHQSHLYAYQVNGQPLNGFPVYLPQAGSAVEPVASDLDQDGQDEMVVIAQNLQKVSQTLLYIVDHTGQLRTGFPKIVDSVKFEQNSPLLADLNRDGKLEIIVQSGPSDLVPLGQGVALLHVLDHNGNPLWQASVPASSSFCYLGQTPAVGNIDGDPQLEIVVTVPLEDGALKSGLGVHVFKYNGAEIINGNLPLILTDVPLSMYTYSPILGDINNDSKDEIIFNSFNRTYVLSGDGQVLWKKDWSPYELKSQPALADMDGDGKLDIVIVQATYVYVLNNQGNVIRSSPNSAETNKYILNPLSPVAGDFTGDGKNDVMVPGYINFINAYQPEYRLFLFESSGTWNLDFKKSFAMSDPNFAHSVSLPLIVDDIDNDGKVDVISAGASDYDYEKGVVKRSSSIYMWSLPQAASPMPWPMAYHDTRHSGRYKIPPVPHPADMNQDLILNIDEVTKYGFCWKTGCTWPIPPNPIDPNYVTKAGLIWKTGGKYSYDSSVSPPDCWKAQ